MYLIQLYIALMKSVDILKRLDRGGDSMKKIKKPCKCNKPYELKESGYTLCLKCGCQYPTPTVCDDCGEVIPDGIRCVPCFGPLAGHEGCCDGDDEE